MPISYEVHPSRQMVITRVDDTMTAAAVRVYLADQVHDQTATGTDKELIDLTDLKTVQIPRPQADKLSRYLRDHESIFGQRRLAIVMPSYDVIDVHRFVDVMQTITRDVQTFSMFGDAAVWLSGDAA
jgi:hypothetical protein